MEQSALSKCQYCLESEHLQKHLVVSVGIKTFLAVPSTESLAEGHCLIGVYSSGLMCVMRVSSCLMCVITSYIGGLYRFRCQDA